MAQPVSIIPAIPPMAYLLSGHFPLSLCNYTRGTTGVSLLEVRTCALSINSLYNVRLVGCCCFAMPSCSFRTADRLVI
jgi:hypothetical protein